jgi:hypothetical protein
VLDGVRHRIRAYVWVEGLALVLAVVGVAFWLGLAVDWMFEPSPTVRRVGLILLALAAAYVGYRYLVRRVAVRISDATAAALLERRFPALSEHLLTAVDVASSPVRSATYHPELVHETQQAAVRAVGGVRAAEVFNRAPLVRAVGAALALGLSIGLFAIVSRDAFGFWLERIALSERPWPRRVHLEVIGFASDAAGRRVHKLARDDDFELVVHALTEGFQVPDEVQVRAEGGRGRDSMIRVGEATAGRDKFQLFRYEFKDVAADIEFDVVGGDDRVRDLRLEIVERPELFAIELECVYPEYLKREPRRLPVTGGMRIPEGTRLTLHAGATKPLTAARIHRSSDQQDAQLTFQDQPQDELRWEYGTLSADDVLQVNVTDTDGVAAREPYRISLAVVRDEVPQVVARLSGIGSAITPEAVLPLIGKIVDDYGLEKAWWEYHVEGGPGGTRPLVSAGPSAANYNASDEANLRKLGEFDTRALDETTGKRALLLRPGQRFSLSLKATDRFNLSEEARAGNSPLFTLDVVTASELLAQLERRELALRQRYEAIYEKMTDTRNLLNRVEFAPGKGETAPPLPSQSNSAGASPSRSAEDQRSLARRRLRVAGSLQNVVQSADEISGVGEAFDDLVDQLNNNRIDNPDLKSRLREQIAQPLHRIGEQRMPQLAARIKSVEKHVNDPAAAEPNLDKAIALADEILVEMRKVLDRMLELETYNEVVALLRDIIEDQDEISRRTKERQRERLESLDVE